MNLENKLTSTIELVYFKLSLTEAQIFDEIGT